MRIYLATLSATYIYVEPPTKVRNGFVSYFILRNSKSGRINRLLPKVRDLVTGYLVCDSGAHSFFSEMPSSGCSASGQIKRSRNEYTPNEYFNRYLKFLKRYHSYFDYFVELDIGELVGQDVVEGWRERIKEAGIFHKCISCYHSSIMDIDYLRAMCRESTSKYLAVEGDRPLQRTGRLNYTKLIKVTMEEGCRLHGFAMTKTDALKVYPFYSVDSSSWNAILKYGKSFCRDRSKPLQKFDLSYMRTDRGKRVMATQEVKAWTDYEDYLTRLWARRGVVWDD
jgi:hypothetical protein